MRCIINSVVSIKIRLGILILKLKEFLLLSKVSEANWNVYKKNLKLAPLPLIAQTKA